ncbi:MAG: F0F1 ATP synthase subunit epsilon [Thermotogaceae bacterium]|nr:F0F1 ATP synthase subunit epsilon [Thermotogaceae bacterium]
MKIKVKILTPGGKVYEKDADLVNFRTIEGAMGILPRRIPIITHLAVSDIEVVNEDRREKIKVAGGFLYCDGKVVSVVSSDAEVVN